MIQPMSDPDADRADKADPLARFRIRHQVPRGVIHLAGAALGAMPRTLPTRLAELVEEEWGLDLLAGWRLHGWPDLPRRLAGLIAPLLGLGAGRVRVVGDPLAAVLPSLLALRPQARRVLSPPGRPVPGLGAALDRLGGAYQPVTVADPADTALFAAALIGADGALADPTALVAEAQGAPCLLDVGRVAGIAPLCLDLRGVTAVIGGGAGYLGGGPGAPGYVALPNHLDGAALLAAGTPPSVLALAVLEVGTAMLAEADPALCLAKIRQLAARLRRDLPMLRGASDAVELTFPCADPPARAAALQAAGVVAEPWAEGLRFSFSPLLLSHADIATAALRLAPYLAAEN